MGLAQVVLTLAQSPSTLVQVDPALVQSPLTLEHVDLALVLPPQVLGVVPLATAPYMCVRWPGTVVDDDGVLWAGGCAHIRVACAK